MNEGLIKRVIYKKNKVFIEIKMDLSVNIYGIEKNIVFIHKKVKLIKASKKFNITDFALVDTNKKYEFKFKCIRNKGSERIEIKSIATKS